MKTNNNIRYFLSEPYIYRADTKSHQINFRGKLNPNSDMRITGPFKDNLKMLETTSYNGDLVHKEITKEEANKLCKQWYIDRNKSKR